jgi:succinate dehydrogenase/fumarate reductase flavoprotein subunit
MVEALHCDILILGSGGAGLLAALHAYRVNPALRIVLASKGLIGKSGCTRMVQGGYNAVLDPADSIDLHLEDTLKGGGYLNDQELAYTLVSQAPDLIRELETSIGCFFDRREDGRIHQKPFAGQSFDRTVHRGDLTGIEIVGRLRDALFATSVQMLEETRALDLVHAAGDPSRVAGALLLDHKRGTFIPVQAGITVLATGGGARMYRIAAPSLEKTGDGMAMAWRAGATMLDMEMYQFHPTGLLAGASWMTGMVLEEGLRGAGGILTNALGERYMERYDPLRMERSTRDVVSRSSYLEIAAGRGTPAGGVRLDVSHLGHGFIEQNFSGMLERCLDFGFDLRLAPVEVSPTAHFHMGGVTIDPTCHARGLSGLLIAGEDAGGTHGANRLGGNGVAESTVFGAIAGETAAREVASADQPPAALEAARVSEIQARALAPLLGNGAEDAFELRDQLENTMWERVGLVRDGPGLQAALCTIAELKDRATRVCVPNSRRLNLAWTAALDVQNLLEVAELTARSAELRQESRGAHFRADFPVADDARWLVNIQLRRASHGSVESWETPVRFTRMMPPSVDHRLSLTPGIAADAGDVGAADASAISRAIRAEAAGAASETPAAAASAAIADAPAASDTPVASVSAAIADAPAASDTPSESASHG